MKECEQLGHRLLGKTITVIEGRSATICYEDSMAVLKMYLNGRIVNTMRFPLYSWDQVRELGIGYMFSSKKPRAGF